MSDRNSTFPAISGAQMDFHQTFTEFSSSAAVDLLSFGFGQPSVQTEDIKDGENEVCFDYVNC